MQVTVPGTLTLDFSLLYQVGILLSAFYRWKRLRLDTQPKATALLSDRKGQGLTSEPPCHEVLLAGL